MRSAGAHSLRQAFVLLAADQLMAPPAVFALPFFQLYSSIGLFDTHIAVALAHARC
jgi:ABC-type glycerol-3-phosphate transport system permease component